MTKAILNRLDNGIRVVTKNIENFESVVLGYWIEAGGACEGEDICGISHFLEHMAFKGKTSRSAKKITEEIESVGGYLNAYTSKETTAFHTKILKENQQIALEILSDILQNPTFPAEELERERGVILQEISQTQDTPDDIIFDYFQKVAFDGQSLGRPILGPVDVVSRLNADDLRSYRSKYYNADNIVFAAAGNVNHDALLRLADEYFSKFQTNVTPVHNEQYQYVGGSYSDIRDLEQTHAIIGFNGLSSLDEDYYTLAIMSSILGGGMSSRLFQEVREKRGLAYSVYAFSSSYKKNGMFGVYTATSADKLAELADVVVCELTKICENIYEDELNRTKAQFRASLLMVGENNSASCEQIVHQTLIFNKLIDRSEILEKINRITVNDVKKLSTKIISSSPASIATVGKGNAEPFFESLQKYGLGTSVRSFTSEMQQR
ncbi:MAG: insulinase family protein [Holosporaceae bacterium]|jgi:predicted Zn-dependent peptidase|nr:insulinase family protein [Holosporaceae bacterium]